MTKINAQIVADSKNEFGNRITTMIVTFPRIILAEFNTHRMFSRNSASSRAIPFEKMVDSVEKNPFIPIAWQKDHKGMQGFDYETDNQLILGKINLWKSAKEQAIKTATHLFNSNTTKQLCNRLLEPFMWHTVIVTATEWENFFALRCPQYSSYDRIYRSKKDVMKSADISDFEDYSNFTELDWLQRNNGQAEIHMMALAEAMWDAYNESIPEPLVAGMWHIPFMSKIDSSKLKSIKGIDVTQEMIKISTAMCARVSYTIVGEEGKPVNYENDIKLHDKLSQSGHWSPFEHCAVALGSNKQLNQIVPDIKDYRAGSTLLGNNHYFGNFRGFIQYRKLFSEENKS